MKVYSEGAWNNWWLISRSVLCTEAYVHVAMCSLQATYSYGRVAEVVMAEAAHGVILVPGKSVVYVRRV